MNTANSRHRLVVVGGGFGGMLAVRWLRNAPVDITLVDRTNHHLFQPLLYQVATGILSEGTVAPAFRDLLGNQHNCRVELAEVHGFDAAAREVKAVRPDGSEVSFPYDSLIVATGATTSYFGHDELAEHTQAMKTIDDALNLRRQIFGAFEMAEIAADPVQRQAWMTFAVVGGGPTGVEVAGQIGELAARTLEIANFEAIDPADAKVILFDGGDEILSSFGDQLAELATEALEGLGVEVRSNCLVTSVDGTGVDVKGPDGMERIEARTVVWAAGVQATPLARALADATGAETDRAGRVKVQPDCTLPGHADIFAIGDMMSLDGLPGVAEVAMQQGIYAARSVSHRLHGKPPLRPFKYRDLGSMATIGKSQAIVSFRGLRFGGRAGFLAWLLIHLTFLTGYRNRVRAVASWIASFVGRGRGERTFTVHAVSGGRMYQRGGDPR